MTQSHSLFLYLLLSTLLFVAPHFTSAQTEGLVSGLVQFNDVVVTQKDGNQISFTANLENTSDTRPFAVDYGLVVKTHGESSVVVDYIQIKADENVIINAGEKYLLEYTYDPEQNLNGEFDVLLVAYDEHGTDLATRLVDTVFFISPPQKVSFVHDSCFVQYDRGGINPLQDTSRVGEAGAATLVCAVANYTDREVKIDATLVAYAPNPLINSTVYNTTTSSYIVGPNTVENISFPIQKLPVGMYVLQFTIDGESVSESVYFNHVVEMLSGAPSEPGVRMYFIWVLSIFAGVVVLGGIVWCLVVKKKRSRVVSH